MAEQSLKEQIQTLSPYYVRPLRPFIVVLALYIVGSILAPLAPIFLARAIAVIVDSGSDMISVAIAWVVIGALVGFVGNALEQLGYRKNTTIALTAFTRISSRYIGIIADPKLSNKAAANLQTAFEALELSLWKLGFVSVELILSLTVRIASAAIAIGYFYGPSYLVLTLIASVVPILVSYIGVKRLLIVQNERRDANLELQEASYEIGRERELITAYQTQSSERLRLDKRAKRLVNTSDRGATLEFLWGALREFAVELATLGLTLIVIADMAQGRVGVDAVFVMITYFIAFNTDLAFIPSQFLSAKKDIIRIEPLTTALAKDDSQIIEGNHARGIEKIHVKDFKVPFLPNFPTDFDVTFERGEIYWIKGGNGSGKSTFLRVLVGLEPAGTMTVTVGLDNEQSITLEADDRLATIAYADQNTRIWSRSIDENVNYGRQGKPPIGGLPIPNAWELDKNASELSGGQRQLVHSLRAITRDREVLILDEPTNALDATIMRELANYLKSIAQDKIIIFASHDPNFQGIATQVIDFD